MLFTKLPRFNPKSSRGLIAKMGKTLDVHSAFLENIKADNGILIRRNADGGITIEATAVSGGTASEGDYAFKVMATEILTNGQSYNPPKFTVSVLGGTAQVYGGSPFVFEDCKDGGENDPFEEVEEGEHVFLVYHAFGDDWVEVAEWEPLPQIGSDQDIANYEAPYDLVFEIACISKTYASNVRQDHKGNIVMPAISNLVDLQAEYVEPQ